MKLTYEITFVDFACDRCWGGAVDTINELTADEVQQLAPIIEDMISQDYPQGYDEGALNDFIWFERDTIAQWLGYENFDEIINKSMEEE